MARPRDHGQGVLEQGLLLQVITGGCGPQRPHQEVDVGMAQLVHQRVVGAVHDGDTQPCALAAQHLVHSRRQQHAGGKRQRADGELPLRAPLQEGQFLISLAQLGQAELHGAQQLVTRLGGADALA